MGFHRVLVVLAILAVLGLAAVLRSRRHAGGYAPTASVLDPAVLPPDARGRLAVLGFRSRFCAACRETPGTVARALGPLDLEQDDVVFVPVDVAEHADLVHHLDVPSTPTVVLVDRRGRVRFAHEGNPEPEALRIFVEEAMLSLRRPGWRGSTLLPGSERSLEEQDGADDGEGTR